MRMGRKKLGVEENLAGRTQYLFLVDSYYRPSARPALQSKISMPETSVVREKQEIGLVVPDFQLPAISGGQRSLVDRLAGKRGAVVLFWSGVRSHCPRYH